MRSARRFFVLTSLVMAPSLFAGCIADPSQSLQQEEVEAVEETSQAATATVLPAPSRGSAVAVSPDDSIVVAVNRDAGSVTVFSVEYPHNAAPRVVWSKEINLGWGSEPWQVVISPDSTTAYVVLRRDQKLVKLGWLKTAPGKAGEVAIGSEPTAVALTPTGAQAYVTSWVDGTVTGIDTRTMTAAATIDLNATLVGTGLLGNVAPRAAMAHPRSLTITNDGDANDQDESIYVTEYFAQRVEAEQNDAQGQGLNADVSKAGIVYKVRLSDRRASAIRLGALADIGFKDENGVPAGCFPNQLQSITANGKFAYVTSVCASPRGPIGPKVTTTACTAVTDCASLNLVDPACVRIDSRAANNVCVDVAGVKTTTAPVVSVIDTTTDKEVSRTSLNARFRDFFADVGVPDDASRRYPLLANDLDFVPGTSIAYVSANGADAVFRVKFDPTTGGVAEVGASTQPFIDLAPAKLANDKKGQNPIGLAVAHTNKGFAWATSEVGHNLTGIDLNVQAVAGLPDAPVVVASTALPAAGSDADKILKGKRFFNTGLARWSLKGQAWGACQSCHTDGLTDNVTWYFARGPRQSISLDGSFSSKDPHDQRIFNWTAIFDEISDFELNTRGVSGGVGAIVKSAGPPLVTADRLDLANAGGNNHAGLNGSSAQLADPANPLGLADGEKGVLPDWQNITRWVQQLRSPRKPTTLNANKVATGQWLFKQKNCQGCHGDDKWTISRVFYPVSINANAALRVTPWTDIVAGSGFPFGLLPAVTPENQRMRFDGGNAAALDQIQCILRPVGTFGVAEAAVAENGRFPEVRANMTALAQGNERDGRGYNPPSLLGLTTGAPYLHAGNARTLEALFSTTFQAHHQALATNFLDASDTAAANERAALIEFLLSIDEQTATIASPAHIGPTGGSFCAAP
jgi:YVTN family beta-propeller protein